MTQPTPSELVLLRSTEQRTQLYLSIYQPNVVFAAQINNPGIGVGANYIDYDTVSSGSYTAIHPGMTLYIGSTPGGSNYGRIRVRSADPTTLFVAENSDINWQDNLYLTVKDFYEVWPIYQVLHQIGNTPATDQILVYKDADVEYAGQNNYPGSLIWMGSHQAAWLENGQTQIYWAASGTVNTQGDPNLSYSWEFGGGLTTGSFVQNPGLITYDTAGHYVTRLSVTSSSGTVDTSYRYVSIYDEANQPINEWGMDDLKGSRGEGAYTTNIWVRQPVNSVVEGALVIVFSKSYYGTTPYSFVNNIEFVGYILNDSITYDYAQSKVEFSVGSVTEVMKGCEGPGVSLTSVPSPTNWSEMNNITIQKAIWWYLRWHTSILNLVDIKYIGTNYPIFSFETDNATLFDALADFMQGTLVGTFAANRQGQIICEVDPAIIHNAPTVISLGMKINREDWKGEPNIREATRPTVNYLEMGGYEFSQGASTGTNIPLLSCAPGVAPSYFGKMEEQQGLALASGQGYLDAMVGDVFAYKNARFPETTLSMRGNYGNIEFVPSERYLLTVEATDSQSRVEVTDLPVHPVELTWKYVPERSYFSPEVVFHELVDGISGSRLDIPQAPIPNVPPIIPPYDIPPFVPITGTPWPPFPFIPPVIPPDANCPYEAINSYVGYPDILSLDTDHPSAYVWFPCLLKYTQSATAETYSSFLRVFYTAHGTNGDYLLDVNAISANKGILTTSNFRTNPGSKDTNQRSNAIGNALTWLQVSGFKINLKPYGLYVVGRANCTLDSQHNVTDIVEGGYPSFKMAWASWGWIYWNVGGICPAGTTIRRLGTPGGSIYLTLQLLRNGVSTGDTFVWWGGGAGIATATHQFDQAYIYMPYIADTDTQFEIIAPGTPEAPGDIEIRAVYINNVCPIP